MARTPQFVIRLNDEDRATLRRIMRRQRLDAEADAVRWLIRNDPAATATESPAASSPRKARLEPPKKDDEPEGF